MLWMCMQNTDFFLHLDLQFPVFSRQLVTKEIRDQPKIRRGRNKKQIGSSKTEVIDPKKSIVNFPRSFPRRTRHLLVLVNTCFTCWPECRALWMMLIGDTMTILELNCSLLNFPKKSRRKITNITSKQLLLDPVNKRFVRLILRRNSGFFKESYSGRFSNHFFFFYVRSKFLKQSVTLTFIPHQWSNKENRGKKVLPEQKTRGWKS